MSKESRKANRNLKKAFKGELKQKHGRNQPGPRPGHSQTQGGKSNDCKRSLVRMGLGAFTMISVIVAGAGFATDRMIRKAQ